MIRYYQTTAYSGCDFVKKDLLSQLSGKNSTRSPDEKKRIFDTLQTLGLDPHSFYQEIEMSSPYVNTHRDITYQYEPMVLHSHSFYEIVCCRTSCGAEYLVGSRRYSLQKGDIILIRPGVSHCAILPDPLTIPYERDILWLSEKYLNSFADILGLPPLSYDKELSTYLIRTANTQWECLYDIIHNGVLEEENKQPCWQTNVIGNTMQFLSCLVRAYLSRTDETLKAETPDLLDEIIAYIEDHYHQKLSMKEIGMHFYISERTISILFRKRLGVSFHQFLTQRRLIAAKTLILEGTSLEIVSERVGFRDYSAFFRAFRSEFGIAPRDFKKLEEQKNVPIL